MPQVVQRLGPARGRGHPIVTPQRRAGQDAFEAGGDPGYIPPAVSDSSRRPGPPSCAPGTQRSR
ncbi:hypothetical protein L083_3861 [Actinoplanes sp. N902-109]|nr:hypothetical protein L083_3861 [Actinoplanes sp. N902-109]